MPKLRDDNRIFIQPATRGRVSLSFPYDPALIKQLKTIPGAQWDPSEKHWIFPEELEPPTLNGKYKAVGFSREVAAPEGDKRLYLYQRIGLNKVINNKSFMLNYEMGLGKTPTAIAALRHMGAVDVLIICPAIVRLNWIDELEKWWPSVAAQVMDTGKKAAAWAASGIGIGITSYDLVSKMDVTGLDAIILDESHYIKNHKAARSKAIYKLCAKNSDAMRIALTATAITSEPQDLWHQFECLWPGRFGTYWKFITRYCNVEEGTYGKKISGLNKFNADELKARLAWCTHRVTKDEVKDVLPPLTLQTVRIKAQRKWNPRELSEVLSSGEKNQHELSAMVERAGDEKVEAVFDLVDTAVEAGQSHICVATHFRHRATEIAEALGCRYPEYEVLNIDGGIPPAQRIKALKNNAALPKSILVTTMHAVNVGINLTAYTTAILAELYWSPTVIVQFLGRFHRIGGSHSHCYLVVLDGSLDEAIAATLIRRFKDQAQLWEKGMSDAAVQEGLNPHMTDIEVFAELRAAAAERWEEEYL